MAGKRNYEWPLATEWDAAAFLTQDKSGGVTQRVSPALVETKLEADGFPKIPSPSANEVAVYGVGGWGSVKLVDANIDDAAAIGWGKISKTGAVASDVGALPNASPTVASGKLTTAAATISTASANIPDGAEPTSPVRGDIWGNIFSIKIFDRGITMIKGASDAMSNASRIELVDALTVTKGKTLSLGSGNSLDVWSYFSGAWSKVAQFLVDGSIISAPLAGTGTRPVAADSTGKLVALGQIPATYGDISANFSLGATTQQCMRRTATSDILVTLPAASSDYAGMSWTFTQPVDAYSLGFTGTFRYRNTIPSGANTWTQITGGSWASTSNSALITLKCDGTEWLALFQ